MALPKNPKADLKRKYKRTLELSFILSIGFLIMAFKFFPDQLKDELKFEKPPELVQVEDIIKTKQETLPPPPPKPPIPIEAPSDEGLEDITFEDTSIDENIDVPPPPQPPDNNDVEENVPFTIVEKSPEIIGGLRGILERIKYPEMAKRAGIEGRVVVRAIVDESGNVESVELMKGIGMGCDDEAMRVIRETKFQPGKQRGRAVRVYVTIPIKFELN